MRITVETSADSTMRRTRAIERIRSAFDVLVIAPGSVAINATSKIAIPAGKIQRGPEVRRSGRAIVSEMTDTTARVIGHLGSPTIRSDIGILPAPALIRGGRRSLVRQDLSAGTREVQGKRRHVAAEVADGEDQLLGEVLRPSLLLLDPVAATSIVQTSIVALILSAFTAAFSAS
jgi:hypothetical protein